MMNSYTEQSALLRRRRPVDSSGNPAYTTAYHPSQLGRLLQQWGQQFSHWLTTGSMPRVSREVQGDTEVWKVYDPVSNATHYFDQENSLRVWMEERYYQ